MSICLSVQGEFFRVGKCQQSPCSPLPAALPVLLPVALPMVHEPMLLLAVTEFVANSAAFTYFTAGALRRNISGDMVGTGPELPLWDPTGVSLHPSAPCGTSSLTLLLPSSSPGGSRFS